MGSPPHPSSRCPQKARRCRTPPEEDAMTDLGTLAVRLFAVIDGQRWDEYETVMHPDVEMTSPFSTLHSAREWAEFSRAFAAPLPPGRATIPSTRPAGARS